MRLQTFRKRDSQNLQKTGNPMKYKCFHSYYKPVFFFYFSLMLTKFTVISLYLSVNVHSWLTQIQVLSEFSGKKKKIDYHFKNLLKVPSLNQDLSKRDWSWFPAVQSNCFPVICWFSFSLNKGILRMKKYFGCILRNVCYFDLSTYGIYYFQNKSKNENDFLV